MKNLSIVVCLFLVVLSSSAPVMAEKLRTNSQLVSGRNLGGRRTRSLDVTVTNLAFQQPFGSFFVMVHDEDVKPLYRFGEPASPELAILAEDGDPNELVKYYKGKKGVFSVKTISGPLMSGDSLTFEVEYTRKYRYLTVASMAINTNDCFVSETTELRTGTILYQPGLDAGSEENNEECNSIPGPACAEVDQNNVRSGNGEGFVHVHRGFFGIGPDLTEVGYDWRNPMMEVRLE